MLLPDNPHWLQHAPDTSATKLEGRKQCFGKKASDDWSKLMQLAEGPKAFHAGYEEMLSKYRNDRPRRDVIIKLFRSPSRHHFSRLVSFVNAVLTDITECLFSAIKYWVFGHGKHSATLFLAIVRIAEGCWKMMQKSYLVELTTVEARVLKWTTSAPLRLIFGHFAHELTAWATERMYQKYELLHLNYDIGEYTMPDGCIKSLVTNKRHGDEFIVNSSFKCCNSPDAPVCGAYISAGKKCWNQVGTRVACCMVPLDARDIYSLCMLPLGVCRRFMYSQFNCSCGQNNSYETHPRQTVFVS